MGSAGMRAWVPGVPGIAEVFHARFTDHVYPPHAHDTWTLMIVDDGVVRYDLHRHERGAPTGTVLLLPPYIAHTGRADTAHGFRKRVLYLDADVVDPRLSGRVVDEPTLVDDLLRARLDRLHRVLDEPGGALEAESRLALIGDRIARRFDVAARPEPSGPAGALRELLDSRLADGLTLREAGALLHADPAHLVRCFGREFGLPPHRYLTGRRVEAARRRLLDGEPVADVAAAVGFHDQSHCTGTSRGWWGPHRAGSLRADDGGSPAVPASPQMSRTRRGEQERETQIIMQSPASRAS